MSQKNTTAKIFGEDIPKPYITEAWKQHAELIHHLCRFSENILLILAPTLGGKTTFLQQCLATPCDQFRKNIIKAEPHCSMPELFAKIAQGFALTLEAENETAQIQDFIANVHEKDNATWQLIIDDAHWLSNEQLHNVLRLVKFEGSPQKQLHLILLGEPQLELRLFSPEFSHIIHGRIYTIELETWNLQDVKAYFNKELALSRMTQDETVRIFERSQGWPGRICREKEAIFQQPMTSGSNMKKRKDLRSLKHPITLGVLFGIFAGTSYLMFHDNSEEGSSIPLNLVQVSDNNNNIANDSPLPERIAQNAINYDDLDPTDDEEEDGIGPLIVKEMTAPSESAPLIAENKVSAPIPKKPTQKAADPQAQHLLTENSQHYTLQLLGAGNEQSVKKFMERHGIENQSYYFHTKLSGKDWFVLVYGDYPTLSEAKQALDKIPASMKKDNIKPWVREMKAVQSDISKQKNA